MVWRSAAGPNWPIRPSISSRLCPFSRTVIRRRISITASRFRARQPARRDDRTLCRGMRHVIALHAPFATPRDEPVLKEIAGRIAADEFRHYKLFYETLRQDAEPDLPRWRRSGRGQPRDRIRTTTNSPAPITAPMFRRTRVHSAPIAGDITRACIRTRSCGFSVATTWKDW